MRRSLSGAAPRRREPHDAGASRPRASHAGLLGSPANSTAGAAYAEFIIAVVPMLVLFWGMVQVNGLLLADLVARNAAINAVRAAIVCDSDDTPQTGDQLGAPDGCSYRAAAMTLAAIKSFNAPGSSQPDFSVLVDGARTDGNEPVTATVFANYHCDVPLVGGLVCGVMHDEITHGNSSPTAVLTRRATLPNQGAAYSFKSAASTQ
jgi:Flp pilus assembly protein TadG